MPVMEARSQTAPNVMKIRSMVWLLIAHLPGWRGRTDRSPPRILDFFVPTLASGHRVEPLGRDRRHQLPRMFVILGGDFSVALALRKYLSVRRAIPPSHVTGAGGFLRPRLVAFHRVVLKFEFGEPFLSGHLGL